jgi:amino acid transporter
MTAHMSTHCQNVKLTTTRACNILAVKAYGEAEFWLSGGKVVLILILYTFTFITMVGGNPQKDPYNPGPMNPHGNGDLGRFEGFLGSLWAASFCVVGPEYISMVSGEARRPRVYIKNAFKTVYFRFGIFFILGALCVGIVIAYNDPELLSVLEAGESSAAGSPYVIAMKNLQIGGLPHLVNALLITSIFSAGNTYTYCATRSLYSMAIEGRAPKILRKCTKNGVPIYCFCVVMVFPFLSFLNLSDNAAKVLTWLTNIITAGGVINYIIMCTTYLSFYRACQAQGLDRKTLPYCGYFQPYGTWIALCFEVVVVFVYGYTTFKPGQFTLESFFTYYTMVGLAPILFVFWKLYKKTKWLKPHEVDLVWDAPLIDAYEASFITVRVGTTYVYWPDTDFCAAARKLLDGDDPARWF